MRLGLFIPCYIEAFFPEVGGGLGAVYRVNLHREARTKQRLLH